MPASHPFIGCKTGLRAVEPTVYSRLAGRATINSGYSSEALKQGCQDECFPGCHLRVVALQAGQEDTDVREAGHRIRR